jgi:hypothetical protein
MIYKTRSGRNIKKPELFKATENSFIDDYKEDEYDTDMGSDIDTEDELYSDEESEYSDDEEDENGNLKDFIVDDDDDDEEEDA